MRVVLATRNAGKLAELRRILGTSAPDVELVGLDAEALAGAPAGAEVPEVPETGRTFEENALLKARAVAAATGLPAVADDSGLCVDALGGMPGVLSARWAGRHGDDEANLRLVLAQLAEVPDHRRSAHFVCVAAAVVPGLGERVAEGRLDGTLTREPRGSNGFGYDPIFVPDGERHTAAELAPADKDAISHRGRAFRALAPQLAALVTGR
ncbi:MAG TPA: RdgB/HAM1 family non-canonical purine NTP pyrophosphatase [Mycobacteriales bacterium]|nr:RdgB/HAM1 family non-canonical purine NTP pyrophosphatase [Mycobacteriales bacterium]